MRVHLPRITDWCIDYSNDAPVLWLETGAAWYMVGGYSNLSSPAANYKHVFRPSQMKFEVRAWLPGNIMGFCMCVGGGGQTLAYHACSYIYSEAWHVVVVVVCDVCDCVCVCVCLQACAMVSRILCDLLPHNKNLSYRAVVADVERRTAFMGAQYRACAHTLRADPDAFNAHGTAEAGTDVQVCVCVCTCMYVRSCV